MLIVLNSIVFIIFLKYLYLFIALGNDLILETPR